ncbi:MAG: efflux RND transporter permease subunit, partial [Spirochaetaceae bacterium]|nr:efflux RND transporter permease subunit [Spirochaetaceae bacterium]
IQFERLVQPLIIMASVPFSFIGVVGGLAVFGSHLSLISFLGIIALAGIVVNNAIVQVDRINQLRNDGMNLDDAVIKGSVSRLRPILMTTLTTFFGVMPLSFASGSGARIYAPLGQAIAGGLVTSTLVTLFLIPNLYRLVEYRREVREKRAENSISREEGVA